MATTAGGLPYVEPSDLVSGWPAVSQSLAEELDSQLAAKAALAGATYTGTHDFTGATVTGIAAAGMTLITTQSFTTAAAVNVNSCFTSTYDNYRILVDLAAGANLTLRVRLRVSGADNSTASSYLTEGINVVTSGSVGGTTSTSDLWTNIYAYANTRNNISMDMFGPALARETSINGLNWFTQSSLALNIFGGVHTVTSAFDGFSLLPSTSTITGSLSVYGYKK